MILKSSVVFCKCGCGKEVKPGNVYVCGHNKRKYEYRVKTPEQLCKCGCGTMTKAGNKYIKGHAGRCFSDEEKRKMGKAASDAWKDKDFRERMCKIRSAAGLKAWQNKESKEKRVESIRKSKKIPGFGYMMSIIQKEIWRKSPERRANMSGPNHYFWNGGSSKEPYSIEWTKELKNLVRKRDNNMCQLCLKSPKLLNVHHINYNKKDNSIDNLITLCVSCHIKTNTRREGWECVFASQ